MKLSPEYKSSGSDTTIKKPTTAGFEPNALFAPTKLLKKAKSKVSQLLIISCTKNHFYRCCKHLPLNMYLFELGFSSAYSWRPIGTQTRKSESSCRCQSKWISIQKVAIISCGWVESNARLLDIKRDNRLSTKDNAEESDEEKVINQSPKEGKNQKIERQNQIRKISGKAVSKKIIFSCQTFLYSNKYWLVYGSVSFSKCQKCN